MPFELGDMQKIRAAPFLVQLLISQIQEIV